MKPISLIDFLKLFIFFLLLVVLTRCDQVHPPGEDATNDTGIRNNNNRQSEPDYRKSKAKVSDTEKQFGEWAGRQFASRMLWMTHSRKFVLPKGTIFQITPKITVPVFRHAPFNGGFDSDLQASWTFYMKFDKLNMTSEDHPWPFDFGPPFYPFGEMMRPNVGPKEKTESSNLNKVEKPSEDSTHHQHHSYQQFSKPGPFAPNIKYVPFLPSDEDKRSKMNHRWQQGDPRGRPFRHRMPRSVMSLPPPESMGGGERAVILPSLEKVMTSFGFSGRECLLRAVCEVHEFPLSSGGYGLFGEFVTLFFSISESPYADSHMPEYLKAERQGRFGDCSMYKSNCTQSLFVWEPRDNAI